MIALYHLASGYPPRRAARRRGDAGRGRRRRSAHGRHGGAGRSDDLARRQPYDKPDGTEVRTLWGELAWQLGGADGYELVAEADRTGTSPGDGLVDLLRAATRRA